MLALLGCNHTSAPVSMRERLAVSEDRVAELVRDMRSAGGIEELAVLSTCNRVEFLGRGATPEQTLQAVRDFLVSNREVTAEELERYTYQLVGNEAVRHLFGVAGGLDSMILGEPQILGQVKQAYALSKAAGGTGRILDRLFQHALTTAKRVRTDTGISRNPVSVAFAAVQLASQIFGDLKGRRALVLGAGKMAGLVAKHLHTKGIASLTVASRTYNHAVEAARAFGGEAVNWDDGRALLKSSDIVVSCTGALHPVLTRDDVGRGVRGRRGGPLFLIDIAVPRDIEPEVNELDNVYLYDIDALERVVDANQEERRRAAAEAESMISQEVLSFERWRQSLEITPLIVSLRETMLELGHQESERFRSRFGPLSEDQERELEAFARSLMQKVLHRPIVRLRDSIDRGDLETCTQLYRELFGLDADIPGDRSRKSREPSAGGGPQRVLKGGKKDPS